MTKTNDEKCQLCSKATTQFEDYIVDGPSRFTEIASIEVCEDCFSHINAENFQSSEQYWFLLKESVWSESIAVKALSWKILNELRSSGWAQDTLELMYFETDLEHWIEYFISSVNTKEHKDSLGNRLQDGDEVTLIKDLDVKGAGFTAKRGTCVKNIKLGNVENHIEGKVNGVKIILLTEYLKKSSL